MSVDDGFFFNFDPPSPGNPSSYLGGHPTTEEEEMKKNSSSRADTGRGGNSLVREQHQSIRTSHFPWVSLGSLASSSSEETEADPILSVSGARDACRVKEWLDLYPRTSTPTTSFFTEKKDEERGIAEGSRRCRPLTMECGPYELCFQSPSEACVSLTLEKQQLGRQGKEECEKRSHPLGKQLPTCQPHSGEDSTNTKSKRKRHRVLEDHRDIIPGQYYGGLKVWSCAPDLARYIVEHREMLGPLFSAPAALVAEVGCGHALPALAAMCVGAKRILLQDYNAEVLDICTGPNIAATVQRNRLVSPPKVKLVHGDWIHLECDDCDEKEEEEEVNQMSSSSGYGCDVVLGSDVTFDKEACDKLAFLLHRWLKPKTGFALLGSKEYYFGTNGGRVELTESVRPYHFVVETLAYIKDGGSMDRVIIKVYRESS